MHTSNVNAVSVHLSVRKSYGHTNATLEKRRELFRQQKKEIENRIKALEETLDVVNYKCAYYDEAIAAGTEKVVFGRDPLPHSEEFIHAGVKEEA